MKPPNVWRACFLNLGAKVWLLEEGMNSGLKILANRSRCAGSVLNPPLDNAFDLGSRAPRDVKFQRHF
jgi:hypothetical protein